MFFYVSNMKYHGICFNYPKIGQQVIGVSLSSI